MGGRQRQHTSLETLYDELKNKFAVCTRQKEKKMKEVKIIKADKGTLKPFEDAVLESELWKKKASY